MGKKQKKPKDKIGAETDGTEDDERPLPKLVLKVGKDEKKKGKLELEDSHGGSESDSHSHHKKKKKKHKHNKEESEKTTDKKGKKREASEPLESEPSVKKILIKVPKDKEKEREKAAAANREPELSPLRLCLENLHRTLQRKDTYGIFQYPVTDVIAPGYSTIIKEAMDFLTMSKKIETDKYNSIEEFRDDFILMCNNAMKYNGSDTIYFKSAEKIKSQGVKLMSDDKLKRLNRGIGLSSFDEEEDAVDGDESGDVNIDDAADMIVSSFRKQLPEQRKRTSRGPSLSESVLNAAKEAREKLLRKYPSAMYGYLNKDKEGNHSLNIINPDVSPGSKQVPVTLGKIAGKLKSGISPAQMVHKEDKKNKVVPVNYLIYGPYGSFGPTYDSSLASLTKEESSLLLSAYGTELGVTYSKSVTSFLEDSAESTMEYVDRFLDIITDGQHSKYKKTQQKKKEKETSEKASPVLPTIAKVPDTTCMVSPTKVQPTSSDSSGDNKEADTNTLSNVDLQSLLSLDGDGIDVSFLKEMMKQNTPSAEKPNGEKEDLVKINQEKLAVNADLLKDLQTVQNKRLSTQFGGIIPVPNTEKNIAMSITDTLKELMGQVPPSSVVSSTAVRMALGAGNPSIPPTINETAKDDTTQKTALIEPSIDDENAPQNVVELNFSDSNSSQENDAAVNSIPS